MVQAFDMFRLFGDSSLKVYIQRSCSPDRGYGGVPDPCVLHVSFVLWWPKSEAIALQEKGRFRESLRFNLRAFFKHETLIPNCRSRSPSKNHDPRESELYQFVLPQAFRGLWHQGSETSCYAAVYHDCFSLA